jgi:hypothetical protein
MSDHQLRFKGRAIAAAIVIVVLVLIWLMH